MIENIRLSFQGIWAHKMRSFLTMLGIIIGIAAIIAIVSTIKGTNEQIKNNLVGSGNNLVDVKLYQDDYEYEMQYYGIPDGIPVMGAQVLNEILSEKSVDAAAFYRFRMNYDSSIYYGNSSVDAVGIYGIDDNYFDVADYRLLSGRGFDERDHRDCRSVMILDSDLADSLFQDADPIGKTVEMGGMAYKVIGIAEKRETNEPVINSIEDYNNYVSDSGSGKIFVPLEIWPGIGYFDEPVNLVVRAVSTDSMTAAGKAAQTIMNQNVTSTTVSYKAEDLLEQAEELQQLSSSTNQQLIWIASISLLVGGIGVMNIMLVSVTERTREIGLKKAIGARKGRILGQFLTEAAVLTSIGGILGVGAGIGLAYGISKVTSSPVAIDVWVSLASVLFSMLIGIIFGLLPSVKAANLDPIIALRRD